MEKIQNTRKDIQDGTMKKIKDSTMKTIKDGYGTDPVQYGKYPIWCYEKDQ